MDERMIENRMNTWQAACMGQVGVHMDVSLAQRKIERYPRRGGKIGCGPTDQK
jgi:hypothetical protein